MDKLLYFPYISIPNTTWTMQSLIYWDEIASIVPFEYTKKPDELEPFTQMLLREGLLKQVHPEDYVFSIKRFTPNFMDYVVRELESKEIFQTQDQDYFNRNRKRYQKIHMGKLCEIGDSLVELGLAFKVDEWYHVRNYFSKAFMTYLAILLSERTDYIAATDRFNGFSSFLDQYDHNPYQVFTKLRKEFRTQILNDILPLPRIDDYYDLLRFKEKYYDQLISFRNHIEMSMMDILNSPYEQIAERKQRFIQQSKIDIDEIKGNMNSFGIYDIVAGALAAMPSIYSISQGVITNNSKDIVSNSAGLLGTIMSTVKTNSMGKDKSKPLAYAAILSKNFKTNSMVK